MEPALLYIVIFKLLLIFGRQVGYNMSAGSARKQSA